MDGFATTKERNRERRRQRRRRAISSMSREPAEVFRVGPIPTGHARAGPERKRRARVFHPRPNSRRIVPQHAQSQHKFPQSRARGNSNVPKRCPSATGNSDTLARAEVGLIKAEDPSFFADELLRGAVYAIAGHPRASST